MNFRVRNQGDVNLNHAQSSGNDPTEQIDDKKASTNAPRRSERLSMARGAAAGLKQVVGKSVDHNPAKMDELNIRNQDKKRKSAPSDSVPEERNATAAATSQNDGPGRQNIRHRNVPEVLPPHLQVARKASRRLTDEFDDIPTKRPRHINFLIRQKQYRDGYPQEHHNLSLTNFEPTKYTSGFSPYDVSIRGDVLQSPEYVSDIFQRLYHSEVSSRQQYDIHCHLDDSNANLIHDHPFCFIDIKRPRLLHAQSALHNCIHARYIS